MPAQIIPFPQELRPALPTIVGNVDYLSLRQRLEQIDTLLRQSGVERDFVERALQGWTRAGARAPTARAQLQFQQRSRRALQEAGTFDALCPRPPAVLRERMKEARFARLQRRRAQTEARIGILKNGFLGRPLRAKGFAHRELALAWGVLTHNLWKLARMRKTKQQAVPLSQAA